MSEHWIWFLIIGLLVLGAVMVWLTVLRVEREDRQAEAEAQGRRWWEE